jgi:3-oxoacyl-[acyl-carrier protein] reductase
MNNGVFLSMQERVALITGGSRGIGAATVRMFVQAGARVVFNYQRARDRAEALVRELGEDNCHAVQMDLSTAEAAEGLVAATVERFGRLDAAVLNHGIWPAEDIPVNEMGYEHWHRTISINLDSTFGLLKNAVAQMKKQKSGGHVVVVSSTAGQRGEAFHVDYAASKGAVISMVKGLSTELARDGIYVNCVAPGWVATDMSAPAVANTPSFLKSLSLIPLGRIGKPEEIAAPILFLCTKHAGFITGEIFNVNGGAVLVG